MGTLHRLSRWLMSAALLLCAHLALAQRLVAVPALATSVTDTTATLSQTQQQALIDKLKTFEQQKGTQIAVLLVASTKPEDIETYANRVANTWKIGRKDVGDGILLVVAVTDHKLRIEVAKSLEGAVTDLQSKRIINQAIAPHFKQEDFAGGLSAGIEALMHLVDSERLPAPPSPSRGSAAQALPGGSSGAFFFFVIIFFVYVFVRAARSGIAPGGFRMGHSNNVYVGMGNTRMDTHNTPSFTPGESYSSGGGGDFGGGGASGDW